MDENNLGLANSPSNGNKNSSDSSHHDPDTTIVNSGQQLTFLWAEANSYDTKQLVRDCALGKELLVEKKKNLTTATFDKLLCDMGIQASDASFYIRLHRFIGPCLDGHPNPQVATTRQVIERLIGRGLTTESRTRYIQAVLNGNNPAVEQIIAEHVASDVLKAQEKTHKNIQRIGKKLAAHGDVVQNLNTAVQNLGEPSEQVPAAYVQTILSYVQTLEQQLVVLNRALDALKAWVPADEHADEGLVSETPESLAEPAPDSAGDAADDVADLALGDAGTTESHSDGWQLSHKPQD